MRWFNEVKDLNAIIVNFGVIVKTFHSAFISMETTETNENKKYYKFIKKVDIQHAAK